MTLMLYKDEQPQTKVTLLLYCSAIAVTYYLFANISLGLSKEPGSVALVWYPNVIVGLILSRLPYKYWGFGLFATVVGQLGASLPMPGQTLKVDLVFTATALSNVSLIAHFVKKHNNFKNAFDTPLDFAKSILSIAIVPSAVSATVTAVGLFLNGFSNLDRGWLVTFASILIGTLAIGPAAISILHFGFKKSFQSVMTTLSLGTIAVCAVVSVYSFLHLSYPFAYLAFSLVAAALLTNIVTISFATATCSLLITTITSFQLYQPSINAADFTGVQFYIPVLIILIPSIILSVSQHARSLVITQLEEQMSKTKSALLNMPALLCSIDERGNTVLASKKFLRIMELDTTDIINYPFDKIVSPESKEKYTHNILNALKNREPVENIPITVTSRYGREIHLSVSATYESNGHKDEKIFHLYIQNVSEEIRLSEQLREENELMSITLKSIGDGVIATDRDGLITFINAAAEALLNIRTEQAEGKHFNEIMHLYDEQSGKRLDCPVERVLAEKSVQGIPDFAVFKNGNGEAFAIQDSISPIKNKRGDVVGTIMVFQDVTETRKISQKMSYLAQHDMLTDLPNRTLLMDRITHSVERTRRSHFQFGIAFMDLDNFKTINDSQGHDAGDQLLQIIAQRLKQHVRGEDTISRIGGDEFVFVFEGISSSKDISRICNKIIEDVRRTITVQNKAINVTCSIGVALCPSDGEDTETLMRRADAAMYRAKHTGRGRVCFYSHEIERELSKQIEMEDSLRLAFSQEEFFLYYQPIVDSNTYEVYATEALCRWKDPKTGEMISPDKFIPILESIGLIDDVGHYLLNSACKQLAEWEEQGKILNMSVNISAKQITSKRFIDDVATTLANHGLAGNRFIFEITETLLMMNTEHCLGILRKLRSMGIRIAVDDFGVGYSSLSYLKIFPFDVLKIDKQFVHELGTNQQDSIFVKGILDMARALSLKTVAEGVENETQAQILREMGCDTLQGFYFSKADSGQSIRDRLDSENNILQFPHSATG